MWDSFDHLVCLNLEERKDRLELARSRFAAVGLADRVHYRVAARSPKGGCYGCFEAHHAAIRDAYTNPNLKNLVIFEDDVVFGDGWQQVIQDCAHFVKEESDWEFLNLCGHIYFVVEPSISVPDILNCKTTKAHAVAFSRAGMKKFLDHYPEPQLIGVDDAYMCLFSRSYGHRNYHAIYQDEGLGTDNPWVFFDGITTTYRDFIQNAYIPHVSRDLSRLALTLGRLPYRLRPWLVSNDFSENLNSGIRIWRRQHGDGEIPWRVGPVGNLLVTLLGIRAAFTMKIPAHISRFRLLQTMLKMG